MQKLRIRYAVKWGLKIVTAAVLFVLLALAVTTPSFAAAKLPEHGQPVKIIDPSWVWLDSGLHLAEKARSWRILPALGQGEVQVGQERIRITGTQAAAQYGHSEKGR